MIIVRHRPSALLVRECPCQLPRRLLIRSSFKSSIKIWRHVISLARHVRETAAAEVAQTLRDTTLYLQRHGWNQGEYYDATCVRFTPPACLVGAVGIVCYGGPVDAPALNFGDPWLDIHLDVMTSPRGPERDRRVWPQFPPVELIARRALVLGVPVDRLGLEQPNQVLVAGDRLHDHQQMIPRAEGVPAASAMPRSARHEM
ncbi:DUF6197 family protein [Dactylosporangium sp. CA-152071]|uniref:DUF6197 family protein n=1 Tax=Dactylosporangium sp. CA-152071 TaxID=3239933 RepID=UPI003D8DD80B